MNKKNTKQLTRYEALVESVDGIVWEGNPKTFAFTFVSRQAQRLLGYPAQRWIDEPTFWYDHIHPEDRERTMQQCIAASKKKKSHELEYRMIAKNGNVVWLRDIVTVILEKGSHVKSRGIMVDITDRKKIYRELAESHARFQALSDATFEGIVMSDDGIILDCNVAFANMFGFSLEELMSYPNMKHMITPESLRYIWKRVAQKCEDPYEVVGVRKDGTQFPIEIEGREILYQGKRVRVAAVRDITERKKIQEQIREYQETLEQTVAERTEELLQANLKKSQFIADASHELRTPLAIAKGNLDLAVRKKSRSMVDPYKTLAIINEELDQMKRVIERLVASSNEGQGTRDNLLRRIRLDVLVKEEVKLLRVLADRRNITLTYTAQQPVFVRGSKDSLLKVCNNLITNAIKYGKHGGHTKVSVAREGNKALLRVSDNGHGIAKKDLPHIFERFYQADTNKHERNSMGLGLAICKTIVEYHGGTISVHSQYRKGSAFTVSLPYEKEKNAR